MSDIDQGSLSGNLSRWMPSSLSGATESFAPRIAHLSIRDGKILFQLTEPGRIEIKSGDLATLTDWCVPSALRDDPSQREPVTTAGEHTNLASLISGPPSTRATQHSSGQFPSQPSLYGDSLVVAAGTDKEQKFTAKSTARVNRVNKQAKLERSLRDVLAEKGKVVSDSVSTSETPPEARPTLNARPSLTEKQVHDAQKIYNDMLTLQGQWYFDVTREEKAMQDEARILYQPLHDMFRLKVDQNNSLWQDLAAIVPSRRLALGSTSLEIWGIVVLMVILVCRQRPQSFNPSFRMELAKLVQLGQRLNRIWMDGYEELYHPMYDV